jgi:DNA-binding Lrp family transcriptional regulator
MTIGLIAHNEYTVILTCIYTGRGALMKVYVLINIRTGEVYDVIRQLKKISQIKEVNMTFGPYDAVAVVESTDIDDLARILASAIQPIPGVEKTLTCLAVEI